MKKIPELGIGRRGNKKSMLRKVYNLLLLAFLFLLPWQTRYIWNYGELNKGYWEYGTFSIYGTEILLWIILILFFAQHFIKKEFWVNLKQKPKRNSLVLLLFFLFLSTILSKNFWISYYFVFKFLEAMALFTVLMWENRKTKYQAALWAGAVAQGILAISQFLTQHVIGNKWLGMASQEAKNLGPSVIEFADQRWLRAYGSFGSPNSLGIYLAVLFVLGLILYIKTESPRTKILISIGQIFILSGLLVSFSRSAWLSAAVGVVCLVVVVCHSERSRAESKNPLNTKPEGSFALLRTTMIADLLKQLFFVAIIVVFWLVIFYPVFTARFNLGNRLEVTSISERQGQYGEALSFIKSNLLFGVGPGAYTYVLSAKYPKLASWQLQPIHNIYLLALVEIGLAGFLFLLLLFKKLFVLIVKNNLVYVPVVVALASVGIFDHWLWSMYMGVIFFWVVWGLTEPIK